MVFSLLGIVPLLIHTIFPGLFQHAEAHKNHGWTPVPLQSLAASMRAINPLTEIVPFPQLHHERVLLGFLGKILLDRMLPSLLLLLLGLDIMTLPPKP